MEQKASRSWSSSNGFNQRRQLTPVYFLISFTNALKTIPVLIIPLKLDFIAIFAFSICVINGANIVATNV